MMSDFSCWFISDLSGSDSRYIVAVGLVGRVQFQRTPEIDQRLRVPVAVGEGRTQVVQRLRIVGAVLHRLAIALLRRMPFSLLRIEYAQGAMRTPPFGEPFDHLKGRRLSLLVEIQMPEEDAERLQRRSGGS